LGYFDFKILYFKIGRFLNDGKGFQKWEQKNEKTMERRKKKGKEKFLVKLFSFHFSKEEDIILDKFFGK